MFNTMLWFLPSREPADVVELKPGNTLLCGVYWNMLFLAIIEIIIFAIGRIGDFGDIWKIMYCAAALLVFGFGFFGNTHTVDVGYKAVPLFFDKRLHKRILSEGFHWLPFKPIMDIKKIDLRKRITPASNTDTTSDNVRVKAEASIEWFIEDMFTSLDVSETVIHDGLIKLIQNVLRVSIREKTSQEILGAYDHIRNSIEQNAQGKTDSWGIGVGDVIVSSIDFLSEDVAKDHERKRREEVQRDAEEKEMDHARKQIKQTSDDLDISPEKAIELFQTEREKVKKEIKEYKITGISDQIIDAVAKRVLGEKKENT